MVNEPARRNTEWQKYEGFDCKLVYVDGHERDGQGNAVEHLSVKKGKVDKVTKTHMILSVGTGKYEAIKLLDIKRAELIRS